MMGLFSLFCGGRACGECEHVLAKTISASKLEISPGEPVIAALVSEQQELKRITAFRESLIADACVGRMVSRTGS